MNDNQEQSPESIVQELIVDRLGYWLRVIELLRNIFFTTRQREWFESLDIEEKSDLIPLDEIEQISAPQLQRRINKRYLAHLKESHRRGPKRKWKTAESFKRAVKAARDRVEARDRTQLGIAYELGIDVGTLRNQLRDFKLNWDELLHS